MPSKTAMKARFGGWPANLAAARTNAATAYNF
jgi:hypothetical protein